MVEYSDGDSSRYDSSVRSRVSCPELYVRLGTSEKVEFSVWVRVSVSVRVTFDGTMV